MPNAVRIWDVPIRTFHWLVAALVVFSYVTGKIGGSWLEWHMRSGYAILALLLFRLAWGFMGSDTARFSRFVRSPVAAVAYLRSVARGAPSPVIGHNPAGGWMVLAMLAALLVQAFAGLFTDDEIATQGPLAVKASNAWVAKMSALHDYNQWLLVALVAVHVSAIAFYKWGLRHPLTRAMVVGSRDDHLPEGAQEPGIRSTGLAIVLLLIAAAIVYALVVIYPRTK